MTTNFYLGHLPRRVLGAFIIVAFFAVSIVAAGALLGSSKGIDRASYSQRQDLADRIAIAISNQFTGSFSDTNFSNARKLAESNGARMRVLDGSGNVVYSTTPGGRVPISATVGVISVDGKEVGQVLLGFPANLDTKGRQVAWTWILLAVLLAISITCILGFIATSYLMKPIQALTDASKRFASGDRSVRANISNVGELGELSRAYNLMLETIEQTELLRRKMSDDVAHELRTPLAALQAGLEEVRDGFVSPTPERLSSLHDSTLKLSYIVADLELLANAEAAALRLRKTLVSVNTLLAECVEQTGASFRAASIGLEIKKLESDVLCCVDGERIQQAIVNLLTNVVKHCPAETRATLRASLSEDVVKIVVADTGPGISPNDLSSVFERFHRGINTGGIRGSGLGLSIAKELIEANGGTISVSSAKGKGTEFIVTLDIADKC